MCFGKLQQAAAQKIGHLEFFSYSVSVCWKFEYNFLFIQNLLKWIQLFFRHSVVSLTPNFAQGQKAAAAIIVSTQYTFFFET